MSAEKIIVESRLPVTALGTRVDAGAATLDTLAVETAGGSAKLFVTGFDARQIDRLAKPALRGDPKHHALVLDVRLVLAPKPKKRRSK